MASTAYKDVGAILTGAGTWRLNGRINNYDNISRSNNTITVTNASTTIQITGASGSSYWGVQTTGAYQFPSGTTRRTQDFGTGTYTVGDTRTSSTNTFTFTVTKDTTSVNVRAGGRFGGDSVTWSSNTSIPVPAAGNPSGQSVSATNVSVTTATLNASISNWGNNCTAGTGQRVEYKKTTDGSWTTLAYSTSTSHSRNLTGLAPGTEYQMRTYTINGAGQTGSSSTGTFTTLPAPNTSAALLSIVGVK